MEVTKAEPFPTAKAGSDVPEAPSQIGENKSTLTLYQANILVAMLGGFWARKADGHPGPDLLGRGLLLLGFLVKWERIKKENAKKRPPAKEARHKPG